MGVLRFAPACLGPFRPAFVSPSFRISCGLRGPPPCCRFFPPPRCFCLREFPCFIVSYAGNKVDGNMKRPGACMHACMREGSHLAAPAPCHPAHAWCQHDGPLPLASLAQPPSLAQTPQLCCYWSGAHQASLTGRPPASRPASQTNTWVFLACIISQHSLQQAASTRLPPAHTKPFPLAPWPLFPTQP